MTCVTYGETARFKAAVAPGEPDGWSVTWRRLIGDTSILIDTNEKKFARSTAKQLVIQPVCMEDDGKYQAVVHRNNLKTSSKTFFLHVVGGTCIFAFIFITGHQSYVFAQVVFKIADKKYRQLLLNMVYNANANKQIK